MADINVERKRPSVLPWIVGAIVLAALIWVAGQILQGRSDEAAVPSVQTP